MFRIGDVRNRSHIIGASVHALIIGKKTTPEGETLPFYQRELPVSFDSSSDSVFLIWPATFVHIIDEDSPLFEMKHDALTREKFEIVVILEGTVESTGQSIQARSSYLPAEILWGRRFENMVSYRRDTGEHRVDYSKFNNTYEVETPSCSAKDLLLREHRKTVRIMRPDDMGKCNDNRDSGYANEKIESSRISVVAEEDDEKPATLFTVSGYNNNNHSNNNSTPSNQSVQFLEQAIHIDD
jgi:potassium inwardly-rectifying channel subfamily J